MYSLYALLCVINVLAFLYAAYLVTKPPMKAPDVVPKESPNLLFKMTLVELEVYLSGILVWELTYIIESDISVNDPNMKDELYGRLLINMMGNFSDNLEEFSVRLGPTYLENFITRSFHRLRITGELDKLIARNALR